MSTTKPIAETGWSKEFPQVEGFYWVRRSQMSRPEAKIIQVWQYEGDWYAYRHGDGRDIEAEDFTKSLYAYLGPLSPSDFEQLIQLRKAARTADEALQLIQGFDFQLDSSAHGQEIRRRAIAAIEGLREALTPKGEQS